MRKLILLLLPMMLAANCSAPAAQTAEPDAEANPDKFIEPETSNMVGAKGEGNSALKAAKPGDPMSPFNADGSIKPAFERETLQRLNAIMVRAKATIDEYDQVRPGVEKLVAEAKAAPDDTAKRAKAQKALGDVRALHKQAIAARDELSVEGQKLVDSKQWYDQVVFSGMATFATRVESEFAEDLKTLGEGLKS
ncbi:MAG: hypothetical protein HC870_00190 [Rhizobiales bacterium]|nr:hypothetical protein [Hyphomicrobiales bacterium]